MTYIPLTISNTSCGENCGGEIGNCGAIVNTDFSRHVGPIVCALHKSHSWILIIIPLLSKFNYETIEIIQKMILYGSSIYAQYVTDPTH